jgi:hypothetical protein
LLFDNITPEAFSIMDNTTPYSPHAPAVALELLSYYGPDSEPYPQPWTKGRLLDRWLRIYPQQWICWALIESIYQGRYKTYCVEQILALWLRRGEPVYHFNHEFETMICNVPQQMNSSAVTDFTEASESQNLVSLPSSQDLDGFVTSDLAPQALEESRESSGLDNEAGPLSVEPIAQESDVYWVDAFEQPVMSQREFDLSSVLSRHQLLPLAFDRIGLEPIHRFMPEAEPIEFCEKLAAIAAHQESDRSNRSGRCGLMHSSP